MYKILIVDDEKKHRTGLMKLLYTMYPTDMFLEAGSGKEALEIMQMVECDIVITDIRMPEMDGLKFLAELRKNGQETEVVILSGYSEFEYAKEAMRFEAADYLLKPVDSSEVKKCLDRLRKNLSEKRAEEKSKESMKSFLMETEPVYMQYLMQQLLTKHYFPKKEKILELFPLEQKGYLFLCDVHVSGQAKLEEEQVKELRLELKKFLNPASSYSFPMMQPNLFAVVVLETQMKHDFGKLKEAISVIIPGVKVRFFASGMHENMYRDAAAAYEEAQLMWNYRFYEKEILYVYEKMKGQIGGILEKNPDFTGLITERLKENDTLCAFQKMKQYVDEVCRERMPEPGSLKRAVMFAVFQIVQNLDLMMSQEMKQDVDHSLMQIYQAENLSSMMKFLYQYFIGLCKDINFQKEVKGIDILKHCAAYMEEHYMEEISLDSMAEKYYFNPSYFSTIFSNYFGKSFTNYLIEIRMKKAKELLLESGHKIKQIAAMTGYRDANYFIRAFKKYYGYTPDEFRKLISQD